MMPTITNTEWQGSYPKLMTVEEIEKWFNDQAFSPDDEIGKINYMYADPVADAHNLRDRQKKWHWTFTSIQADIWDEEHNSSIEIDLDEPYRMLYEILPHGENFQLPLIASVFKDALKEVMYQFPQDGLALQEFEDD